MKNQAAWRRANRALRAAVEDDSQMIDLSPDDFFWVEDTESETQALNELGVHPELFSDY